MSEWRPKHCSCGGTLRYEDDGRRVWSYCDRCTPREMPTDESTQQPSDGQEKTK